MMGLILRGQLAEDPFTDVSGSATIPDDGAIIVGLEQWQDHWQTLVRRPDPIGIRLESNQHPEVIADDLEHFSVIALNFPVFKDGRAYSYARLLRDRYGYAGELRAIGDVLLEQIHFMERVGFDAFEIDSATPLEDYRTATGEFSVWYQPSADGRETAVSLRHRRLPGRATG